ncbi:MAG: beta-N-acetylhexosaminidase [Proteobacteria bacterium]|nr:beta-N-acetylhexosaminidase [Pseudomonadota bacterium]
MLMIGIEGLQLAAHELAWLAAPEVGGVILFTRNYSDRAQLTHLIDAVRGARAAPLLIAVDQEGGPVQRFREGFTRLPALDTLGALWDRDAARAVALAEEHAWIMASELRAMDVDLSFAPVLDLARGNRAIGTRALHADAEAVATLGQAYVRGMRLAGMAATLKHFPGHGSVLEDTHLEGARDARTLAELRAADLRPFAAGFAAGAEAVMMAHVTYPAIDALPAGYSPRWIKDILQGEMGFAGIVISDDVGMAAAASAGGVGARVAAHYAAGCHIVLACAPALVPEALAAARAVHGAPAFAQARLAGQAAPSWAALLDNPQRARFLVDLASLQTQAVA